MAVLQGMLEALAHGATTAKMASDFRQGFTRPREFGTAGASERSRVSDDAKLKAAEARYEKMLKQVQDLQSKDVLSVDEEKSLKDANDQLKIMSDEIDNIKAGADKMNSSLKQSSSEMSNFAGNADEAGKKVGVLRSLLSKAKDSALALAAGYSLASLFSDLSENTNDVIESYYSVGKSMDKVSHSFYRLSRDTWNYSRAQSQVEEYAIRMNMPMETGTKIISNLSNKVNTLYRTGSMLRRNNIALDAAKEIMAFSRITGSSIENSEELYTRFINQFGKSHLQATHGMNMIARAGQLVNENLEAAGVTGHIFLNDITGILDEAAKAFDGFTLNVESMTSTVAYAVEVGNKLGMTYNQAMDTAKQTSALLAKPGGYVAFQAGEKLKNEIANLTRDMDSAEDRAQALSSNFGVSLSTARTLDMASKGVNAQMNVMEILKGTEKGIDAQWDLLQQQAKNNSLSPEILKQFIGGENLTAEQAGDMLQMLRAGGSRDEFKQKLAATTERASADKVIDDSILGPKMIKDWIKQSDMGARTTVTWMLTTAASIKAIASSAASNAKYILLIGAAFMLFKKWGNIKQLLTDTLGEPFYRVKALLEKFTNFSKHTFTNLNKFLAGAMQSGKVMWNRVIKPGQFFDKARDWMVGAKDYLSKIPEKLHDIWTLFKSGTARVQATITRAAAGAAAGAAQQYQDWQAKARERLGNAGERVREYAGTREARARTAGDIASRAREAASAASSPEQARAIRTEAAARLRAIRTESNARLSAIRTEAAAAATAARARGSSALDSATEYAGDVLDPFSGPNAASPETQARHREARRAEILRRRRQGMAGRRERRGVFGRIGGVLGDINGAVGGAHDRVEGARTAGGWAGKAVGAFAVVGAASAVLPAAQMMMSDPLDNAKEEEENTAGGRKYNEEIKKKSDEISEASESLELAKSTGNTALIAAIEAEVKAKRLDKENLDTKKKAANDTEAAYNRRIKLIKTTKEAIERLEKKKNKTDTDKKLIEELTGTVDKMKKEAGKDKGALEAQGISPTTEVEKYSTFNKWFNIITGSVQGIFGTVGFVLSHWNKVLPFVGKTLMWITTPLRALFRGTNIGTAFMGFADKFKNLFRAGKALGFLGRIFTKLTNPMAALGAPVTKLEKLVEVIAKMVSSITGAFGSFAPVINGMFTGVLRPFKMLFTGVKWVAKKLGIISTIMSVLNGFTNTEGSIARKIVGGVSTGIGAAGTMAAGNALAGAVATTGLVSAGVGTAAGVGISLATGYAAQKVGEKTREGGLYVFDRMFGDDADIKSIAPTPGENRATGGAFDGIPQAVGSYTPQPAAQQSGMSARGISQQDIANSLQNGTGTASRTDSQGYTTLTLRVGGIDQMVSSASARNSLNGSGLSGGR